MSTVSGSLAGPPPEGHRAAAGEPEEDRTAIGRLGLRLFIASESMLFAAFIAARFYLNGTFRPETINPGLGVGLTLVLAGSSVLAYRALAAIRRDERKLAVRWLAGTILLGVLFLVGVAIEWSSAEFGPGTPFGTAFFSTTGLHAAHVLSGLVVLALVGRLIRRGHFSAEAHWGLTASVVYWTFVDALWVFVIFPTLYLL
ncbi:MAG: cytochrome c oxidase subunit 3 [Candidatus Limnocylindrales bacterium]|nr:cytochrome c oxidase subunit 3 [Candidatus Limnocylindrales bacterium]